MNDIELKMMEIAKTNLKHAYAPYSGFHVSCCICAEDNTLYAGVNVENASYGLTHCAETGAICQMITAGQKKIKSIIIMSSEKTLCPPCGACRQRIMEFSLPHTEVLLSDQDKILKKIAIHDLLPLAFTFKPFLDKKND